MKNIQELYSEIMNNEELKAQFIEAAKAGKQEAFLKEQDCEATLEEVQAFLEAKQNQDAPLSFDELENAAGGDCYDDMSGTEKDLLISFVGFGAACAVTAMVSHANGEVGAGTEKRSNICNHI